MTRITAILRIAPILLAACARVDAAGPSEVAATSSELFRAAAEAPPGEGAFWWIRLGEISSATVWFGPVQRDSTGRSVRYWTLNYASAGAPQPLVYFQSVIDVDSVDPIGAAGGLFNFELRPSEGRSWRSVEGVTDLEVEASWPD